MRRMVAVFLILCQATAVTVADEGRATTKSAGDRDIRLLVERLGARQFRDREQATRQLKELGPVVLPVLNNALSHSDPEIRQRCRSLLVIVKREQLAQRLDLFLRQPDPERDNLIPGWPRYRDTIGRTESARKLFVQMQTVESRLFLLSAGDRRQLAIAFDQCCAELQAAYSRGSRTGFAPAIAALLFLAADPNFEVAEQTTYTIANFSNYSEFRSITNAGETKESVRALLAAWIGKPKANGLYQRVNLALRNSISAGLVPAMEMIQGPANGYQLQYGILAIGRFGNRGHLPMLEKLLADKSVLSTTRTSNKVTYTCEVRDVVLAVLIRLTGQSTANYGFKKLSRHSTYLFSPGSAGFVSEETRKTALKKWADWKASAKNSESNVGKDK